ncbi:MAG: hypothetical protein NVS9B12_14870 [Vulcanimicrobiaceae bacterium]
MSERNYFRLAVDFRVEMRVADYPAPVLGTLTNISEGGCKVAATPMILKDAEVCFELPRPGKPPLKLRGKVAHIDFNALSKTFEYGIQYFGLRPADSDEIYQFVVEEQRRKVLLERPGGLARNGKAEDRSPVLRVERTFPIQSAIYGQRIFKPGTATDVSRGGMRIVLDQRVPEDHNLELRFTLPDDVLEVMTKRTQSRDGSVFGREITIKEQKARAFSEVRMQVKVLAGSREIRGSFHYSAQFVRPKPEAIEEIERFLHAAQLTELKAARMPQQSVWQ